MVSSLSSVNIPGSRTGFLDLVCFSHLRWDFVYQRPQHLLTRFAAHSRVFYIEEPVCTSLKSHFVHSQRSSGVTVVVPHIARTDDQTAALRSLLDEFFREQRIHSYVLWFYTPMALPWARHLKPAAVVYDCMDELSGFKGAPPEIKERENELLRWADLVFTGGHSLYEAKCHQHHSMYSFPSSIDAPHFARARTIDTEPDDQAEIPGVRLGFFGVIDERIDLDLLAAVAAMRPEWHLILVGPIVKIDPASVPRRSNIHYLGMKTYEQLPSYIAAWDVAMLPFAHNDSTRFISPTKTPEYLAAGLPVVSTSIRDVVSSYGKSGIVHIADSPEDFIVATEKALAEDPVERLRRVDSLLSQTSWSRTWGRMSELLEDALQRRNSATDPPVEKPLAVAVSAGRA